MSWRVSGVPFWLSSPATLLHNCLLIFCGDPFQRSFLAILSGYPFWLSFLAIPFGESFRRSFLDKKLPESFQKPCKIDSKRSKIEVWRELRFGSFLGLGFFLCPGVSRGSWPRCGSVLEAPRGVLGGSWGACGTVFGRLWCDLGRLGVVLVRSLGRFGNNPKKA